jgi:hypothetical protein
VDWKNISRWEPAWTDAYAEFGLGESLMPAYLMPAMAMIESEGNQYTTGKKTGTRKEVLLARDDGYGGGRATGILQVKPELWQDLQPDANVMTPDGNIRLGTALMAMFIEETGSWQKAIKTKYHPGTDPNSGATPQTYVDTVTSLMSEIINNVKPEPARPVDPLLVIVGGKPYSYDYGFKSDAGLNYYCYGNNHGTTSCTQHTGIDIPMPRDTRLYTPIAGVVDCVGGRGTPRWGQGCGAYADVMGGGVGNITIFGDSGHKLTLGHCNSAFVEPGQRVAAGQLVADVGGMNGWHVHVEVSVNRNGTYWLLEPKAALIEAMGGEPAPPPEPDYAPRLPVPQPAEFDVWWTLKALEDGVPVLQRADLEAPIVRWPLSEGEEVDVCYFAISNDKQLYAISTLGSRIPASGLDLTPIFGTITAPPPTECPDLDEVLDALRDAQSTITFAMDTIDGREE